MSLNTDARLVLELVAHHGAMNVDELTNLNDVSNELDDVIDFELKRLEEIEERARLPKSIEERIVEITRIDEPDSDDSDTEDDTPPMCKAGEVSLRRILSKVKDLLDNRVGVFGRGDGGWGVVWYEDGKCICAFNVHSEYWLKNRIIDGDKPPTAKFSAYSPVIRFFDDEDELVKFIREYVAKDLFAGRRDDHGNKIDGPDKESTKIESSEK